MIKTFRGLLADGEEDKIRLSTKQGKIGYKIVKFDLISDQPTKVLAESVVKIFKVTQSSITDDIDFSDGNLLAVGLFSTDTSPAGPVEVVTIFEQEIFNQDIYVTHTESHGTGACNYYLELETINMTDNQAAVSTLRDIRLNPQVGA